ncbi:uncharacterized protein [Periplaneta americana]|uniref:uncharacterized protein isoform X3 n=1 Tax=Periplaneta americana TaxID=6978 RepID=UPI0037E6FB2F
MYVIKKEREIDPLAIEGSNRTDVEEQKPLSEERNVSNLQVTAIKTECMDHSYVIKTEMTFDEAPLPVDFPVVKSEVEDEARELDKVEKEVKLEITAEEDEVLTESCNGCYEDRT